MPRETSWPGKAGSQLAQVSISWLEWLVGLMMLSGLGFGGFGLLALVVVLVCGRDGVVVDDVGCGCGFVCR